MAEPSAPQAVEMKRSLTLTGITVNAMALIAPGAFLWTTFQIQAAQVAGKGASAASTAADMWPGLLFALLLALPLLADRVSRPHHRTGDRSLALFTCFR